jgi:hypothetical protein
MKKMMFGVVWLLLCAAGCIRIESGIKTDNDGRLTVARGDVEVNQAIRQLIAERGWTSEGAGARSVSTTSVRTGVRVSSNDGVQLPGRQHEESADTWILARTDNGKVVHFDITRASGRPMIIRVGVEDGARVSRAEITADLARRLHLPAPERRTNRGPLTIRLESFTRSPADPNRYTARWTARGDWPHLPEYVQFEVRDGDRSSRSYGIRTEEPGAGTTSDAGSAVGSTRVRLTRPAGVLVLEGDGFDDSARGTASFEPNAAYVRELTRTVQASPAPNELLELFFRPVALEYARQMKQALAGELTLPGLLSLNNYHVPPEYVRGSRAAGYAFTVEQFVRLTNYHIPLETLQGFKRARYDFSVDDLIRIRNYHLEVEDFTGFRAAGYDFSIDEMIRAKNYHVPVETARALRDAGLQYNLDEIIRLQNYHISPEDITGWKRAGYELSLDDLIKARNYHLDPAEAGRFKRSGYDFSLDDLIKLRNYHVPADFIVQLHDPDYENFTADELIDFHQKRLSAETINKIRTAKRRAAH